ncbi:hypothetical protein [Parvularcula lutaonensis]|uniref:Peptidase M50 domain-containing protein n=1 Tax=Parvularcula lutaonensis TaxID=491923 RepID=A0ABV7MBK0_9PROT|nr:hypothetical protein [Parvularcula lutaonensis]GGY47639.1 hypothetical protein GCM10007148_16300 [Parvularcula lutaonensis]
MPNYRRDGFAGTVSVKTILTTVIVTVFTFVAHETAHAVAAKVLGYDVVATINHVSAVGGIDSTGGRMLVDIAGPLATVLIAAFAAVIARVSGSLIAFWVVFSAAFMRIVAQFVSLSSPNDEMRVSAELGIGAWTLPAAVIVLLVILAFWAGNRARPGIGQLFLGWIGASLAMTAVVFGENYLPSVTF